MRTAAGETQNQAQERQRCLGSARLAREGLHPKDTEAGEVEHGRAVGAEGLMERETGLQHGRVCRDEKKISGLGVSDLETFRSSRSAGREGT